MCCCRCQIYPSAGKWCSGIAHTHTHIRSTLSRFAPLVHNYMQKTISLIEINLVRKSVSLSLSLSRAHSFSILFIQLNRITHFLLSKLCCCFIWFQLNTFNAHTCLLAHPPALGAQFQAKRDFYDMKIEWNLPASRANRVHPKSKFVWD